MEMSSVSYFYLSLTRIYLNGSCFGNHPTLTGKITSEPALQAYSRYVRKLQRTRVTFSKGIISLSLSLPPFI